MPVNKPIITVEYNNIQSMWYCILFVSYTLTFVQSIIYRLIISVIYYKTLHFKTQIYRTFTSLSITGE